uniref:Uncharacterized protein n=1 Tax=Anguilla anguilla TaxID=7936 RepID=A0A0E9V4J7_ANGAN
MLLGSIRHPLLILHIMYFQCLHDFKSNHFHFSETLT